jgi:hypothetical protein
MLVATQRRIRVSCLSSAFYEVLRLTLLEKYREALAAQFHALCGRLDKDVGLVETEGP